MIHERLKLMRLKYSLVHTGTASRDWIQKATSR